jgi:UDP-GlcNAc:undecaprenyl-phosphate GlcNAc-1-phosphate transferase
MMDIFLWLLWFLVYVGLMHQITKLSFDYFKRRNWLTFNYRGESIIQSFGLNIMIHYGMYVLYYSLLRSFDVHSLGLLTFDLYSLGSLPIETFLLIFIVLGLSMMGWADDHYGTKDIKGLKGHLTVFFYEKRMTSGMMKVLVGSLISITVSYFLSANLLECLFFTMIMLLCIHFFNLLDVRPGRTIKSFWLFILVLVPFLSFQLFLTSLLPVLVSTIILFDYDRHRLAMLGDTGSNVLGGVFGFYLIFSASFELQLLFFTSFLLLSIVSEKYSFTAYINKTPWLSMLDNWGIR